MKPPKDCTSKEEIRAEIDRIDSAILDLLAERLGYVREIVKYKSNSVEVIAQDRFTQVIETRKQQALQRGLNPDVIGKVYHTLLEYFINEQYKLLDEKREK